MSAPIRGWEAALTDARKLVQPAAAWELHPVKEILHERVVLQGGAHIGGGPVAALKGQIIRRIPDYWLPMPMMSGASRNHERTAKEIAYSPSSPKER